MAELKRRNFLKIAGLAILYPTGLTAEPGTNPLMLVGLKPEFPLGTLRIVRNAEGHIIETYRYCRYLKAREFIGKGKAVAIDEQSLAYPMKISTLVR